MTSDLDLIEPLPAFLTRRYAGWKATVYKENAPWYRRLADEGQRPRFMLISCCDSRVQPTTLFGVEQGEAFVHRNIANLVPPYQPSGDYHGTSAAVEYAVSALKVTHLVVLGHSDCGGVEGCRKMCAGEAPELEEKTSFVGRWLDMMRPAYESLEPGLDEAQAQTRMEQAAVLTSARNLMTFPFVASAVENKELGIHALWHDIGEGDLWSYDPAEGAFEKV